MDVKRGRAFFDRSVGIKITLAHQLLTRTIFQMFSNPKAPSNAFWGTGDNTATVTLK